MATIAVTNIDAVGEMELELLALVTHESGRPVTRLALLERDDMPGVCQDTLLKTAHFSAIGVVPRVSYRPLTLNINMYNRAFMACDIPSWRQTAGVRKTVTAAIISRPPCLLLLTAI
jgi:hypothetical protein